MALRQLSPPYCNGLVILVLCCSVMAIGVDVIIVIVVVVIVVVVNFCCPPVAIKSWQHNVTWAISVIIVIRTKFMLHSRSISMKKIIKKHISPHPQGL